MLKLKANPDIRKRIEALYDTFYPMARGDGLTHDQIADILGLEKFSPPWRYAVERVRRRLLRSNKNATLKNEPGVGYSVATIAEQLNQGPHRLRRARRQLRRGVEEMAAIPDDELTPLQRQARHLRVEQTRQLARQAESSRRFQELILSPRFAGERPRPVA